MRNWQIPLIILRLRMMASTAAFFVLDEEKKRAAAPAPAEEEKWTRAASIDFILQQTSFKYDE